MKFESNRKEFVPFNFTITLETKEEAEYLYRLFNLSQQVVECDRRGKLTDNENEIHMELHTNYARVFRPDLPRKPLEELVDYKEVFPDMSVGKIIRGLRLRDGLTQAALAKRLGVNASYIGKVERDVEKPSLKLINNLSNIFKVGPKIFKVKQ